jgi:alpha-ketoglutarate-dependent taurine dioxygenase
VSIKTRTLQPFGLEVQGLNLWQPTDEMTVERLSDWWSRHGVLLFRRQSLAESDLVEFSNQVGDADVIVREDWKSAVRPEVIHISNMKDFHGNPIGGLGAGELNWHTDQSYVVEPATGSILYMVEMPAEPPVTYWSNLQLAYDALDENTQAQIDNLQVVYDYLVRQSTYDDEPKMSAELRKKTPPVTHPLVNTHPTTGAKALYLDPTTAAGIVGWSDDDAKSLLAQLTNHATRDEFVYAHHWQIGDLLMWDNGFLMHRRDAFDASHNRLLKRTTLRLPGSRHIVPSGALAP